jgi:hypothetical protein
MTPLLTQRWRPCKRPKCLRERRWLREVIAERDAAVAERDAAVEACRFVKDWLQRLEASVYPDDIAVKSARAHFHAPLHAKLDSVLERKAPA